MEAQTDKVECEINQYQFRIDVLGGTSRRWSCLGFGGPFRTAHVVPQKTVVGQVGKFHINGGWLSLFS